MSGRAKPISRVLFCVADQWRGDTLGALGTPGVRTPNLDALAADGMLFANHWCQASPCGPSRSSLLTGTHLPTHGQWTNDHRADHGLTTLPVALRSADVAPILIGYTDTPQPAAAPGPSGSAWPGQADWRDVVDPAFEVAEPFIWQHGFPTWRAELASRGYDVGPDSLVGTHPFGLYAPDADPNGGPGLAPAHYRAEDSDVAFLTDAAIEVLGRWPDRAMLHCNWLRPHPPMTAPRPYHRLVDPDEVALPSRPTDPAEVAIAHPYFELTVPGRSMTEYLQRRSRIEDVEERDDRRLRATYYGLCAEVDTHLGRLVEELKRRGDYDSTLIIFTSDHGDALGDHWIYGRRGPFDGHFRVPCIVRDPRPVADPARGTVVDDFTANIDLLPTICEAMGVDVPETVEGTSLLDLLHRPVRSVDRQRTDVRSVDRQRRDVRSVDRQRTHVRSDMSWDDHLRSSVRAGAGGAAADRRFSVVRTATHRLVVFPTLPPMLFDLVGDPLERTDRGRDPAYAGLRRDLEDLLR